MYNVVVSAAHARCYEVSYFDRRSGLCDWAHRRETRRQWRDRTRYSLRAKLEVGFVHRHYSSRLLATMRWACETVCVSSPS